MFDATVILAGAALVGLCIVAAALLRGWQGWLDLKRRELDRYQDSDTRGGSHMGAARIELADLKERLKKLEAIASGVDL